MGYSALASAVIMKAYEDMTGPQVVTYTQNKDWRKREKWRADAREFLLTPNDTLKMWCIIGGLNMKAIMKGCQDAADKFDKASEEKV